ncbi:hypothetical protein TNCV_4562861 [Trichonephila clavipes]|uniref:Uncharacterized protein n=1 Tax=Trichonephila clavipes TaxID=2585209 RepID=A0A8X7BEX4_TRICX|nr:hypothetical protein TNCV_4562861 [Trichonephila clavipes]
MTIRLPCPCGLVAKVTDSWPVCHEFGSSTAEDSPCRALMHVKSVEAQMFSRWWGESTPSFPEDTAMPSSGLEPEPTRLQTEYRNHHTWWGGSVAHLSL